MNVKTVTLTADMIGTDTAAITDTGALDLVYKGEDGYKSFTIGKNARQTLLNFLRDNEFVE